MSLLKENPNMCLSHTCDVFWYVSISTIQRRLQAINEKKYRPTIFYRLLYQKYLQKPMLRKKGPELDQNRFFFFGTWLPLKSAWSTCDTRIIHCVPPGESEPLGLPLSACFWLYLHRTWTLKSIESMKICCFKKTNDPKHRSRIWKTGEGRS